MDTVRTNYLDGLAYALVIIGALNWGLVGAFEFNLVSFLFDASMPMVSRLVYILVGLSGLYLIIKIAMRNTRP